MKSLFRRRNSIVVSSLIILLTSLPTAQAEPWTIGNNIGGDRPLVILEFLIANGFVPPDTPLISPAPAQSFTGAASGPGGVGTPVTHRPAILVSFSFHHAEETNEPGTIYIFDRAVVGGRAELPRAPGLLGQSASKIGDTYFFSNLILDPNATYYAYSDQLFNFESSQGDPYPNPFGEAFAAEFPPFNLPFVDGAAAGFVNPDHVFSARFIAVREPSVAALLGSALLLLTGNRRFRASRPTFLACRRRIWPDFVAPPRSFLGMALLHRSAVRSRLIQSRNPGPLDLREFDMLEVRRGRSCR